MKNGEIPASTLLKCPQCSKVFKYESEKKRHEESHFPRYKCKVCAKKFSFISSLHRHEKQHNRNGNVKCEHCGGSFRDDILLKRHMNYKHKGCYTCSKCNMSYNSEQALHSHMKTHKPEAERKYRCIFDGCNKSFNFHHHLKHHELTHVNKKQYYCDLCNKGFIQLHHFKTHLKAHDPTNWVYCNTNGCKKKFSNEYARKRHQATCQIRTEGGALSDSNSNFNSSLDSIQSINDIENNKQHSDQLFHTINNDVNTGDNILDLTVSSKISQKGFECSLPDEHKIMAETPEVVQINSCKTVLGECLTTDSENNCICAQITTDVEELDNLNSVIGTKKACEVNIEDVQLDCEGCECAASCKAKNSNFKDSCLKRLSLSNAMPPIQYINGTVKIKDAFDIDIALNDNDDQEVKAGKDNIDYVLKSCEAALGKCIVSGNGTIGEGCLCAKMMVTEEVTAEEIDDITPQPNTYFKTDFI